MRSRRWALVLCGMVVLPGPAPAQRPEAPPDSTARWLVETLPCIRPRARLQVELRDGAVHEGRYIDYSQDSLWVARDDGRALYALPSLQQVSLRSTWVNDGIAFGAMSGAVGGFALGSFPLFFETPRPFGAAVVGALLGGYAGGMIGSSKVRWDPLVPRPGFEKAHRRALAAVSKCVDVPLQSQDQLANAAALLEPGRRVRVELKSGEMFECRFVRYESARLTVSSPEYEETFENEAVRRLWVRRRATARGGVIGAIVVGVPSGLFLALLVGAFSEAFCESNCTKATAWDYTGAAALGGILGGAAGCLVGSLLGSAFVYYEVVYP